MTVVARTGQKQRQELEAWGGSLCSEEAKVESSPEPGRTSPAHTLISAPQLACNCKMASVHCFGFICSAVVH